MKYFFLFFGLIVAAMWGGAHFFRDNEVEPGKTVLYWSTDPNPARNDQLAPFMEAHPDIIVKVEPNTFEKTIVQCSTGIGPDIIEIYSVFDFVAYVEAGILMDLTEKGKEMGFSPDSTYPKIKPAFSYNGRQYAYPANIASQVLMYNKKMFRDAGIDEPTGAMAWEDFIELVQPLTVEREGGRGFEQFAMVMARGYATDIHKQFGARFYTEDGTRCIVDSPESIAAMRFYYDLMKKHEVIPTPDAAASLSSEGGWGNGEIRWFATGRAACIWGSRWMMSQFRQYPDLREEIGVVLLPCPSDGKPVSVFAGRTPAVNVNTKHPKESLLFMQYLASKEYSETIAMGSDALPPSKNYAMDEERLVNPEYPWETYQDVFVKSMEYAEPREISPFVNPKYVDRLWTEALEKFENDLMTVEEALQEMAKKVNDRIERNVKERKDLRKMYEERIAAADSDAEQPHTPGG